MKEIRDIITVFQARPGEGFALATLVRTRGSSYRRPGARLLIDSTGRYTGALSGGCLEEEVAQRAQEVMVTGRPVLLNFDTRLRYGCNGAIDILLEKLHPDLLEQLAASQAARRECLLATVYEKSDALGTRLLPPGAAPPAHAFVQTIPAAIRLVLIGEGPDSAGLRGLAAVLGWDLIEAEEASALPPVLDRRTAAIVKTHNYGRDYAALEKLLPLGLPYLALLGPRRRRDQLLHALIEAGVEVRSELFAPAGLDLGAETPEQIALAMVAEIQAIFAGASAASLRERKAPIHLVPDLAVA